MQGRGKRIVREHRKKEVRKKSRGKVRKCENKKD